MEEKRPFGEYIRKKRLEVGLTQKELAGRLFVTESSVSKWERNLSYPDVSLVTSICRSWVFRSMSFSPPATTTRPTPRSGRRRCAGRRPWASAGSAWGAI